jgi:hypothetical protein
MLVRPEPKVACSRAASSRAPRLRRFQPTTKGAGDCCAPAKPGPRPGRLTVNSYHRANIPVSASHFRRPAFCTAAFPCRLALLAAAAGLRATWSSAAAGAPTAAGNRASAAAAATTSAPRPSGARSAGKSVADNPPGS